MTEKTKGLKPDKIWWNEADDVDLTKIDSSVLRRIIKEVKNEDPDSIHAFDRVHTRHNR